MRTLLAQPDALTYQFITEVAPVKPGAPTTIEQKEIEPKAPSSAFTFLAQLFYRSGPAFDAEHCVSVHGAMGVDRQILRFPIRRRRAT